MTRYLQIIRMTMNKTRHNCRDMIPVFTVIHVSNILNTRVTQTKINLKFGPLILNLNTKFAGNLEWGLSATLLFGLGILYSSLYLTQYRIINEQTRAADRVGEICRTSVWSLVYILVHVSIMTSLPSITLTPTLTVKRVLYKGPEILTLTPIFLLLQKTADCGLGIRVRFSRLSRTLTATSNACTKHFTHFPLGSGFDLGYFDFNDFSDPTQIKIKWLFACTIFTFQTEMLRKCA